MNTRLRVLAVAVLACLGAAIAPPALGAVKPGPGLSQARVPQGAGLHRGALLVRFAHGTSDAALASIVAVAGAAEVGRMEQIDTLAVTIAAGRSRAAVVRAMKANRAVVSVETDTSAHVTLTPNDPYWPEEWFARKVRVDRAWNRTTGRDRAVIAVLDTGVQASQPDLEGRVLRGYDFVHEDNNAADDVGHGTRVAGIINAVGMNRRGVAGMCWDCRILPVKVADRKGEVRWSNAAAGLIWATDHGARVVNMSFGHTSGSATMARRRLLRPPPWRDAGRGGGQRGRQQPVLPGGLSGRAQRGGDRPDRQPPRVVYARRLGPRCRPGLCLDNETRHELG